MGLTFVFDAVIEFLEELFALIFEFVFNLNSIGGGDDEGEDDA